MQRVNICYAQSSPGRCLSMGKESNIDDRTETYDVIGIMKSKIVA